MSVTITAGSCLSIATSASSADAKLTTGMSSACSARSSTQRIERSSSMT
jgi:hypothetical protein